MQPHSAQNTGLKGFDDYDVTLGDYLRGERATMGKSLEDAELALCIRLKYLQAIENCDLEAFESKGFIAGYVRAYARYLGLNPDALFEAFCAATGYSVLGASKPEKTAQKSAKAAGLAGLSAGLAAKAQRPKRQGAASALDEGLATPRFSLAPAAAGLLSGISLVGVFSVSVVMMLIAGLGFGAWMLLNEVQRVDFAPSNQTPDVANQMAVLDAETRASEPEAPEQRAAEISAASLDQLYRPNVLERPALIAREAPIGTINPNSVGSYTPDAAQMALQGPGVPDQAAPLGAESGALVQVTQAGPQPIDVIALEGAWIRVYLPDGAVVYERLLNAGQRYRLPEGISNALLRAGNATSVYVMIGSDIYGPVSDRASVVRRVSLDADEIAASFEKNEALGLDTQSLAAPVNLADLGR